MSEAINLTETIDKVHDSIDGDKIVVKEVLRGLESRGYGPLLLALSMFILLPTGAIPIFPDIIGLVIIFLCVQLIIGRKTPWLPEKIRKFSVKREKFEKGRDKIKPYTKKIDKLFKPRLQFMTGAIMNRLYATICIVLAITIFPLGFIPFAAMIPAFAIALFGISISTKDGLMASIACATSLGSLIATYFFVQNLLEG